MKTLYPILKVSAIGFIEFFNPHRHCKKPEQARPPPCTRRIKPDVWIRSNGRCNTDIIDGCMNRHLCIAFRGIFKRHRGFSKPVFIGSFFPLSALRCRSSSSSLPLLRSTKGASIGAGFPRHSFCFFHTAFGLPTKIAAQR